MTSEHSDVVECCSLSASMYLPTFQVLPCFHFKVWAEYVMEGEKLYKLQLEIPKQIDQYGDICQAVVLKLSIPCIFRSM